MAFRHRALVRCLRVVFSENRGTLFRIICQAPAGGVFGVAAEPFGGWFVSS
jgi:hypothetical protein